MSIWETLSPPCIYPVPSIDTAARRLVEELARLERRGKLPTEAIIALREYERMTR